MTKIPEQLDVIRNEIKLSNATDVVIMSALRSLIRNELFLSFKENREIEAWTDDECRVQTKLHETYLKLNGNGEEALWWKNKESWKIVSQEEYDDLVMGMMERKHPC